MFAAEVQHWTEHLQSLAIHYISARLKRKDRESGFMTFSAKWKDVTEEEVTKTTTEHKMDGMKGSPGLPMKKQELYTSVMQ